MAFSIAATMIVKNEADILPFVLSNTLDQVDALYVINNDSIDNTEDIILSFGVKIAYYECKKEHYNHSKWMTFLANMAIKNYDWVVPIDGDEMWNNLSCLRNSKNYNFFVIKSIKNHMFTNYPGSFHPSKMPYYREGKTVRNTFRPNAPVQISEGSHEIKGVNTVVSPVTPITIDHYPFRSEAQYLKKVTDGANAMFARNTRPEEAFHWKLLAKNLGEFDRLTGFRKTIKLV
jgi:hypothetical protein